jgi:hypothetical protein
MTYKLLKDLRNHYEKLRATASVGPVGKGGKALGKARSLLIACRAVRTSSADGRRWASAPHMALTKVSSEGGMLPGAMSGRRPWVIWSHGSKGASQCRVHAPSSGVLYEDLVKALRDEDLYVLPRAFHRMVQASFYPLTWNKSWNWLSSMSVKGKVRCHMNQKICQTGPSSVTKC